MRPEGCSGVRHQSGLPYDTGRVLSVDWDPAMFLSTSEIFIPFLTLFSSWQVGIRKRFEAGAADGID
jgi:hypothetical protein